MERQMVPQMEMVLTRERAVSKTMKRFTLAVVSLVVLAGISGCFNDTGTAEDVEVVETSELDPTETKSLDIPENVSAQAVVLAAFILANGDIGAAIEKGLVTPDEAQLAKEAIDNGELQLWIDAAQAE